ncbi:Uncharacterized protein FWK35_00032003, partial [Aphis craccivora]
NKEENNFSGNESISSEEELNKTKETGTQVGLNKNIEVEKLVEISINTEEVSETTQEYIKEKYSDDTKGKSLLDTTFRDDLRTVKRKQRTKMSSVKATIEQVTAMIPVCADAKDVCSVIRACDFAIGAFEQQLSPQTLQIRLNSVPNKTPEEARILRQNIKDQTLAIYINGLKMDLQTILRARNPETLELAMQMARQLEIEFSFN